MKINFYATFRPIVGGKTITLPVEAGCTVDELIEVLIHHYPALAPQLFDAEGKLFPHVHIFINGRDAPYLPAGMQTPLKESDTVDIFPPVGGGSGW